MHGHHAYKKKTHLASLLKRSEECFQVLHITLLPEDETGMLYTQLASKLLHKHKKADGEAGCYDPPCYAGRISEHDKRKVLSKAQPS